MDVKWHFLQKSIHVQPKTERIQKWYTETIIHIIGENKYTLFPKTNHGGHF